jgi:hypothetical protein
MGWGDVLTTAVTGVAGAGAGSGVGFLSNLLNQVEGQQKADKAENAYYAALAQQKQLAQIAGQTAAQRAAFEKAMKERILTQTGDLGSTLRAAQTAMGAMPQVNQTTINSDYAATKQTMMGDFQNMLKLVESQGRAGQIERLGGAGSMAADNDRMNALMKQYSGELQKIDDAAYDSAISRATNQQNLINTNRQNTLNEISGVYNAQLNPELQLLTSGGTDITNLMNSQSGYLNQTGELATNTAKANEANSKITSASLGALLAQTYNNPNQTRLKDGSVINWNT